MNANADRQFLELFYFEPALKEIGGHYLETFLTVSDYCCGSCAITLFGSVDVQENIRKRYQIIPFFINVRDKKYKFIPSSANRILSFIRKRNYFAGVFAKLLREKKGEDVVLFFPSLEICEILGVIAAMRKTKSHSRAVFILRYTFSPGTVSYLAKIVEKSGLSTQIRFFSDSSLLIDYYHQAGLEPVKLIPIPHLPESRQNSSQGMDKDTIHILYAGGARIDKGFDQLPTIISHVRSIFPSRKISFLIHGYISGIPSAQDLEVIQKTLEWLNQENIPLIKSPLERDAYYQMLSEADIILFPYVNHDPSRRYLATSGILAEAMALGKVVVVPGDTWLGMQVQRSGGGTIYQNRSELPHAVEDAIQRMDELKRKANDFIPYWQQENNMEKYVHLLLGEERDTQQQ